MLGAFNRLWVGTLGVIFGFSAGGNINTNFLLQEDGFLILQEDGSAILLEFGSISQEDGFNIFQEDSSEILLD